MIWVTLVMSLRELRRNTMRSVLTMLGVIIGVSAVIALVTLGQGATTKVRNDVSSMGNNLLTIMPGSNTRGPPSPGSSAPSFTLQDVAAIEREIKVISAIAPAASKSSLLVYGNKNHTAQVQGTTAAFFSIRTYKADKGRILTESEVKSGAASCVIGKTVETELFTPEEPVGQTLRIGKMTCKVVGVLASKGQSTFGQDQDDLVVMPIKTLQRRLAGNNFVPTIYVSAESENATTRAKSQIESLLRERRRIPPGGDDNFRVMDSKELADTLSSVTAALTGLLAAIAGVSLLVGGIGIMNIMLVSVTERTREIGIRLAIGARGAEVLLQFLVEAIVLSLLGGLIGMALGLGGSWAATRALGLPLVIQPTVVVIALGFSAFIGVVFGFLPARKAARLNPIDALRHE